MASAALREVISYLRKRLGREFQGLKIDGLVVGLFFTGVKIDSGHAGVAFTPIGDVPEAVCCPRSAARMPEAGRMLGRPAVRLIDWALDSNVVKSAIGVALLNACTQYLLERHGPEGFQIHEDKDVFGLIDFGRARRVVLVGAFTPFIMALKKLPVELLILEKDPKTLRGDEMKYYRPASEAKGVLSECDVAILTGTTIVNHTVDELLGYIRPRAVVCLAGPTASMIPLPFFERGVDFMGGVFIKDADEMLETLAQAGSGYHLFGRSAVRVAFTR